MIFKIDENLPLEVSKIFRDGGHKTITVLEQKLGGESDIRIAEVVKKEKYAFITLDLDFADIRAYPPNEYSGLIVLRLSKQDKETIVTALRGILPILHSEPLKGLLLIVEEENLRMRNGK